MGSWHWIDYSIVAIIGLSLITGLMRGVVKELVALSIWVIAGFLCFMYAKPVALWLATYVHDATMRVILAYILIVVGTLLAGSVLSFLITFLIHHSGLSGTDRVLGLGFGFLRGIFVVSLLMVVVRLTGMPEAEYQQRSVLYHTFDPMVNWMYQYAPAVLKRVEKLEHPQSTLSLAQPDVMVKDLSNL